MKDLFYSQKFAKVCLLFLASTLAPQWLNANESISLREFVALIPNWEVPPNSYHTIVGDGGYAFGLYQLHEIMVEDYNRITGKKVSHAVAFDPAFSSHIAYTILAYYKAHMEAQGVTPVVDHFLFIWNGGGNAWKRVDNPIDDQKQKNLERYRDRAMLIINQYIYEQKRRQPKERA